MSTTAKAAASRPDSERSDAPVYDIVVKTRGGGYTLFIRELGMAARSDSLEAAHRDLERQKREYLETMAACGCEHEIPPPRAERDCSRFRSELAIFAGKLLIAFGLAGATAVLSLALLTNKLTAFNAGTLLRTQAVSLEAEMLRFNEAPENVKKRRVERLRSALRGLQPALDDLRRAWASPATASPGSNR